MSSDRAPESLVSAWQQQPTSGFRMVPSDFARNMRADARKSRRQFGIGLVLSTLLTLWSGAVLFAEDDPILRVGAALTMLALVFSAAQIVVHIRRVRAVRFDVDRTSAPSLASARAYLRTRRVLHSGRWLWSRVVLLFPGPPLVFYGGTRNDSNSGVVFLVVWIWLLVVAVVVQRSATRRYDRLLHGLDDIECDSPV